MASSSDDTAGSNAIAKGFVSVDGRLMHYVRRGHGPAVVMLHAAPCSAKVMAPLQAAWADDFTTFAFDLPGFGLSDMIVAEPLETRHLADAVAGAITAIGLAKVALYGRHTGAGVAVELARRHPEMCSMVLTDGYPVFSDPYTEERLAEYLVPIEPRWDGTHLVWTWYRYREQHMFWPWDRPQLVHRADADVPDLAFLYRGTIELLESGPNYPKVYASAFRHPGLKVIDEVKVPVCYGNRPGDSQYKTRLLYPRTAWTREFPRSHAEAAPQERDVLAMHPGSVDVPAWRTRLSIGDDAVTRDYIATSFGPVYVRGSGLARSGLPVLVLHDLPGGIDLEADLVEAIGRERPVLGFDMLGNGNTELASGSQVSPGLWARQACEVLDALDIPEVQVVACGTAAAVACELLEVRPGVVRGIVLRSPPVLASEPDADFARSYAPDITPAADGGNFLRLWHHLRDQELWWPWNEQTIAHARTTPPRIAPAELHRRALVLLKQPAHYQAIWQTVLDYPLYERIRRHRRSFGLIAHEQDTFAFATEQAAAVLGRDRPALLVTGDAVAAAVLQALFELQ